MIKLLDYGVEDWFNRPSRNGIELANSFGPMQRPQPYFSTAIPPEKTDLNYGIEDWKVRPPRYGINLAKSFAPAEISTPYFAPSSYPVPINYGRQQCLDEKEFLSPNYNRVVF